MTTETELQRGAYKMALANLKTSTKQADKKMMVAHGKKAGAVARWLGIDLETFKSHVNLSDPWSIVF